MNQEASFNPIESQHDASSHLAVIESFLSVCETQNLEDEVQELRAMAQESFAVLMKWFHQKED